MAISFQIEVSDFCTQQNELTSFIIGNSTATAYWELVGDSMATGKLDTKNKTIMYMVNYTIDFS